MGKVKKVNKKFQYNRNRRKEWLKTKKLPSIRCTQLKDAWDGKKTLDQNMSEMGLSSNPNRTLAIPKAKDLLTGAVDMSTLQELRKKKLKPAKMRVQKELEAEANLPQPKRLMLSEPEQRYAIHMMEKYGDDYKAMARDRKNYYQDTPKQIKKKISTFKGIPELYKKYLDSKTKGEADT